VKHFEKNKILHLAFQSSYEILISTFERKIFCSNGMIETAWIVFKIIILGHRIGLSPPW
jgi:hypothetical protein